MLIYMFSETITWKRGDVTYFLLEILSVVLQVLFLIYQLRKLFLYDNSRTFSFEHKPRQQKAK